MMIKLRDRVALRMMRNGKDAALAMCSDMIRGQMRISGGRVTEEIALLFFLRGDVAMENGVFAVAKGR